MLRAMCILLCFGAFGRNSPYFVGAGLTGVALMLALNLMRGLTTARLAGSAR